MKTAKRHIKQSAGIALVLALTGTLWSGAAVADYLLQDTQRALNSAPIDVDGYYQEPREPMDQKRRQLERQNEDMVQSRIEDIRIEQERKLSESLSKAFTRGMQEGDSVRTSQAAPSRSEAEKPKSILHDNRVVTGFGITSVSGNEVTDFESKIDTSIAFESQVTNRISVGLGIGYMVMDVNDMNPNNQGMNYNNYYYGYNSFQQSFGREMDYKQLSLELDGKFYIIPDSRIRPFVGLGLGYRRTSLKYSQQDPNQNFNSMYGYNANSGFMGDEKYRANYVTASAKLGSDVNFTDMIGARFMLGYTKGLTSGGNESDFNQSLGQFYLRNVGENIAEADFFTLGAGLIISF